jgi:aminopeptidase
MKDPRVQRLAHLLVHYSVKLKKGQLVKIQGEPITMPLLEAVYEEALKVGANPYTSIVMPAAQELFLKQASKDQMSYISPVQMTEIKKMDALIHVWGTENTRHLSGIDPKRQAAAQAGRKKIMDIMFSRIGKGEINWVGTLFPTQADAQEAGMSLTDYEDFVYSAGHVHKPNPDKHWKKVEKEQMRLKKILDRINHLHIEGEDTDLKMQVKGRKWVSCHGTENFPDGEIFTSPIENTVEGQIRFSYPAVYGGREVEDVRLEFKKGRVVKESATRNQEYLTAMLNMDKGARGVGEIAIGTNYEIKRFTKNILFDEKIGGTCHLACGASIVEAGGKNKSGLHWDMVCNMRKNGRITADGKVIYRNGKFVI